jgi:hypothetical protein
MFELADCEQTLLVEIANPEFTRSDVARTYSLTLRSSESATVDWRRVNDAILARWSRHALDWIKRQAHSGKCWE